MPPPIGLLQAKTVIDRVAALMNDPARTDYTYAAVLPYLNMAIDELMESLEEANASPTNQTSSPIACPIGTTQLIAPDNSSSPSYPYDLAEIQSIGERLSGTTNTFIDMIRKEFIIDFPATESLLWWRWEDQIIKFNTNGATTARDIQIKYVRAPFQMADNEEQYIGSIGSRPYLSFKTAAICAMFIAENPTRAQVLDGLAEKALDRMINKDSKGRQEIFTRRRPFRGAYKYNRGWV